MNTVTCLPSNGLLAEQKIASTRCLHKALHGAKWLRLPLLLLLVAASNLLRGQADIAEGYYYIENKQNSTGYYLCPTRSFNYNGDKAMPYLTTYQTGKDNNSLWRIIKVMDGEDPYYRLLHVVTGKYLTVNEAVTNTATSVPTARMRLHLEASDSPGEATLFFAAKHTNGNFAFRPKSSEYYDATSGYCWFDIADGNQSSYNSGSYKGTLGFWHPENEAISGVAKWALESATWSVPVISHDDAAGTFSITFPIVGDGVSTYYTTDGTTPTAASTPYTLGSTISDEGVTILKAVAIKDGVSSAVAEMFPLGKDHPYLIRSLYYNASTCPAEKSFYMIPSEVSGTDLRANSTSVPMSRMLWYFSNAGIEDDLQYYYIHGEHGYLYCVGSNDMAVRAFVENDDAFKFRIQPYYVDGVLKAYHIVPFVLQSQYVHKSYGNANYGAGNNGVIGTNGTITNTETWWDFVPKSEYTVTPPFTVSTDESVTYYRIANNNSADYYIYTSGSGATVTTSNATDAEAVKKQTWYLKEASAGTAADWGPYYYVINASTGEYLYCSAASATANTAAFTTKIVPNASDSRFLFMWAQSPKLDRYFIVPKVFKETQFNNINSIRRDNGTLKSVNQRNDGNAMWSFVTTTFQCEAPVISFDAVQGNVTMTSSTPGADIYYIGYDNADGADPDLTTDENRAKVTKYTGPFYVGNAYYKAIAARSYVDGSDQSAVGVIGPLAGVTCATPQITCLNNKVSIDCSTQGVTIYYTTDGSTPTTSSAKYEEPFSITGPTTVKAIAVRVGLTTSAVAAATFGRAATPVIKLADNGYSVEMTSATETVRIYYTTDGSTPTIESAAYTGPVTEDIVGKEFKAVAIRSGYVNSEIGSGGPFSPMCATPTFIQRGKIMEIVCVAPAGATIRYTLDGSTPNSSSPVYSGPLNLSGLSLPLTIKAYASAEGYNDSQVGASATITSWGDGTEGNPIIVSTPADFAQFIADASGSAAKAAMHYVIANDIALGGNTTISETFTGSLTANTDENGRFYTISGLSQPLFNVIDGGVVCNIMLDDVNVSSGNSSGNTGAIACEATGDSRIYNVGILGGAVSGSGYTGGLVGLLDGYARVINCYSYADITGGTTVGGIVGYNNYATTQTDLRTMVMNCMMYGDITGSTTVYPVYGGVKITNKGSNAGVNNYNFYRDEASITVNDLDHYNCSWPVEEEFLTRFDYVRSALNANRELCAWWITGNVGDTALVAKWVYAPEEATYPILKSWGRYPSMINRDIDGKSLYSREGANAYEGKAFGMLDVTVESGKEHADKSIQRIITDMDTLHHDYGYYKIQLPYYNDVFGDRTSTHHATRYGGNYTDSVVVGWEVVSVVGGTEGEFSTDRESGYNFADRYCTQKDIFAVSGRVFAQGGYYYVPEGVTQVSIKAHWAKAYYCANIGLARDRVDFNGSNTDSYVFTPGGTLASNFHGQTVYAGLVAAQKAITNTNGVYDNAIVLVGNVQHRNGNTTNLCVNGTKNGFTIMSVDLDFDDEPDYVLPLQTGAGSSKPSLSPIRFDFVQVPDMGMVLKRDGDANRLAVSCIYMDGHFEITETSALHFTELYFGNGDDKLVAPVIFNGGRTLEFVAGEQNKPQDRTQYIIAGGNAHMRSLYQGNHNRQTYKIKHAPMSVLGGEFDECYLSGNVRSMAASAVYQDNPRLYTNGGRFAIIAGAGQEAVNGDVYFQIDHSVIDEFYGGSTSETGVVTGNINVEIDHSLVGYYCGGPMVGNMAEGKTITTRANGSTFRQFFGAGNGGTSYTKIESLSADLWDLVSGSGSVHGNTNADWELQENYSPMRWNYKGNNSYEARYHFELWTLPSGTSAVSAARRYVYGAQFAATRTGSVSSTLDSCILLGDFYGAGNLGAVNGDVTSTLTDCTVHGSAFGAGYSASIPSFECYPYPPESFPWQDPNTSICHDYKVGQTVSYTWTNEGANGSIITKADGKYVHTGYSLENLGSVTGDVSLTVNGATHIMQNVFGGGNESAVIGNTSVLLEGKAEVSGNVYGGGNVGTVSRDSRVTLQE